ncbi:hypothetical protein [Adonisia turfae]|nr:hypothetical protein [Adonisia turfae]
MARAKQKGPGGRPTKLTKTLTGVVVRAIKDGNYQNVAFAIAGIPESTAYQWIERGERALAEGNESAEEFPFIGFSESIKKAVAESESASVKRIKKSKFWQSDAWYLERKFPERWSLASRIDQAAEKKAAQTIDRLLEVVSDDAKREITGILTGHSQPDSESSAPPPEETTTDS